jgi:hypothetical protein
MVSRLCPIYLFSFLSSSPSPLSSPLSLSLCTLFSSVWLISRFLLCSLLFLSLLSLLAPLSFPLSSLVSSLLSSFPSILFSLPYRSLLLVSCYVPFSLCHFFLSFLPSPFLSNLLSILYSPVLILFSPCFYYGWDRCSCGKSYTFFTHIPIAVLLYQVNCAMVCFTHIPIAVLLYQKIGLG